MRKPDFIFKFGWSCKLPHNANQSKYSKHIEERAEGLAVLYSYSPSVYKIAQLYSRRLSGLTYKIFISNLFDEVKTVTAYDSEF